MIVFGARESSERGARDSRVHSRSRPSRLRRGRSPAVDSRESEFLAGSRPVPLIKS